MTTPFNAPKQLNPRALLPPVLVINGSADNNQSGELPFTLDAALYGDLLKEIQAGDSARLRLEDATPSVDYWAYRIPGEAKLLRLQFLACVETGDSAPTGSLVVHLGLATSLPGSNYGALSQKAMTGRVRLHLAKLTLAVGGQFDAGAFSVSPFTGDAFVNDDGAVFGDMDVYALNAATVDESFSAENPTVDEPTVNDAPSLVYLDPSFSAWLIVGVETLPDNLANLQLALDAEVN